MILKDIMETRLITVPVTMHVEEVARLLVDKGISGAPVEDGGKLVGVISLSDLVAHARAGVLTKHERPNYYRDVWMEEEEIEGFTVEEVGSTQVGDIMTPVVFDIDENAPVAQAAELMMTARIHRLIVTRKGKAVGIVTTSDMMRLIPLLAPPSALPA